MNHEIITDLKQHKSRIIEILAKNNWEHFKKYFFIREKTLSNHFDNQFKKVFCEFYALNGPGGLNKPQKAKFFELLSFRKHSLEEILINLHAIPGYGNKHKLFLSFGTKLIHTKDEKLPIYDRNIAFVMKLSNQAYLFSLNERIKNRIDVYNELKNNFCTLLTNHEINSYLKCIRKELSREAKSDNFCWRDELISDTKLLDSSLWALYAIYRK